MPRISVYEIEDYLNKKKLPQFVLFEGDDIYSHKFGADKLFSKLKITLPEMNLNIFEGRPELRELKNAMETLPMMSENRAVWLQKADIWIQGYNSLVETKYPQTNYLIISTYEKASAKSGVLKYIEKNGTIFNCKNPDEYQAVKLIVTRAREKGFFINNSAAKTLFDICSGEMKIIDSELEKLFCVCTAKIDKKDVIKYTAPSMEQNVFKINDFLCSGKYKDAIDILNGVDDDKDKLGILSLLGTNIRRMLVGRACIDSHIVEKEIVPIIVKKVGGSDWAAKNALKYCFKFNKEGLRYALKKLSEIDFSLKQGIPVDLNAALVEIYSNKQ